MDPRVISELFTAAYGTQILTRGTRVIQRPGWYQVVSPGSPVPARNEVIHSAIAPDKVEHVVSDVMAEYATIPTPFKWCMSPLTKPINLPEILTERGFSSWRTRDMYFEIDVSDPQLPATTSHNRASDGLFSIESVTTQNLSEYIECFFQGWWLDREATDADKASLKEDVLWAFEHQGGQASYYLARVGGEPAATAGLFLKEHSGYLTGGNILKRFRGGGLYRRLVNHRLRVIAESGRNLAITGARESTSAPLLEKLGFKTAFRTSVFQYGGRLPE